MPDGPAASPSPSRPGPPPATLPQPEPGTLPAQPGPDARDALLATERELCHQRRSLLDLPRQDGPHVGLALSGGGIRSATFSLGLLQALSRAGLLREIDYVSTVSGGGYTGAFLGALLRAPGRFGGGADASGDTAGARPTPGSHAAAGSGAATAPGPAADPDGTPRARPNAASHPQAGYALADRVLGTDDSVRELDGVQANGTPILHPVRWLRESGRYLTPTRSGDWLYAGAYWLRSLLAVHYVGAVALLGLWSLWLMLARALDLDDGGVASPLWLAVAALAWLLAALMLAYWPSAPRPFTASQRLDFRVSKVALPASAMALLGLAARFGAPLPSDAGALAEALARLTRPPGPGLLAALDGLPRRLAELGPLLRMLGVLCAAAFLIYLASDPRADRVEASRRKLTRWLAATLRLLLAAAAAAAVDTLARYVVQGDDVGGRLLGTATATLAALAGLLRWLLPGRPTGMPAAGASRRWLAPLALAVSSALCAALATVYAWLVYRVAQPADALAALPLGPLGPLGSPGPLSVLGPLGPLSLSWAYWVLFGCALAGLGLALLAPGFLNLSTFHNFYAARLTRAYLGAANLARLACQKAGVMRRQAWVSEGHTGDLWTLQAYYGLDAAGRPDGLGRAGACPLHLINVTLNEQRGGTSDLVQRDRKGVPLSVGPAGVNVDGRPCGWGAVRDGQGAGVPLAAMQSLKLGNWVAISGAALSTGVGAETRLGLAMLATLCNARLGYWWRAPRMLLAPAPNGRLGRWRRHWRANTLACLAAEMTGGFWGRRSARWYLSDGGHFENTAAYELIRRRVPLIIVSDGGADPGYGFGDLANLARKARLDLGAEIEVLCAADARAQVPARLAPLFGAPADFRQARRPDDTADPSMRVSPCALLARVHFPAQGGMQPPLTLLVIKPALAAGLPVDVMRYAQASPRFPQEPTADQFFDEAQWESYRKLGETIGTLLFGAAEPAATAAVAAGSSGEPGWAPRAMRPLDAPGA